MAESFWNVPDDAALPRIPVTILSEQAAILTEVTDGVLEGVIDRRESAHKMGFDLDIKAPAMGGYVATLISIHHSSVDPYPVEVIDVLNDDHFSCIDEGQFVGKVRDILSAKSTTDLIGNLLASSKAGVRNRGGVSRVKLGSLFG